MNTCTPELPPDNPAACGCCEGIVAVTPLPTANRPGLSALSYRVGTHSSFMASMLARLASSQHSALADLTSRESGDFALALLDAWATVADVLTFYQERIANEGYLRTATERRSLVELSRLVGYQPRPGVAASTYLAYTLDDNAKDEVIIPVGARAQSIPGPGELPQTFETSQALKARAAWNNLKPRLTRPQIKKVIAPEGHTNEPNLGILYLKGTTSYLKIGDPLLIAFDDLPPELYFIRKLDVDHIKQITLVIISRAKNSQYASPFKVTSADNISPTIVDELVKSYNVKYRNAQRMVRQVNSQFGRAAIHPSRAMRATEIEGAHEPTSITGSQTRSPLNAGEANHAILKAMHPELGSSLGIATRHANPPLPLNIKVYALRVEASLFGHNAPLRPAGMNLRNNVMTYQEWEIDKPLIEPETHNPG